MAKFGDKVKLDIVKANVLQKNDGGVVFSAGVTWRTRWGWERRSYGRTDVPKRTSPKRTLRYP